MTVARDPMPWLVVARDVIAFAIAAGAGITLWLRKRSSRHWPMTHGRVEFSKSYDTDPGWITDVFYSYNVGDEFYSGRLELKARTEAQAYEQDLTWRGQSLTIRYSPRQPSISIVRSEEQSFLLGKFRQQLN
jgi:hypothetical protein